MNFSVLIFCCLVSKNLIYESEIRNSGLAYLCAWAQKWNTSNCSSMSSMKIIIKSACVKKRYLNIWLYHCTTVTFPYSAENMTTYQNKWKFKKWSTFSKTLKLLGISIYFHSYSLLFKMYKLFPFWQE